MGNQFSIFDYTRQPFAINKPIRMVELFAGYGSQSMAMERLGVDSVCYKAIEVDKYAMESFNQVHGTDFKPTDICDVKGSDLEIIDKDKYCYILTYSFPCTDISVAGQMQGMAEDSNTRSSLLWQVKRILSELNETDSLPQVLLMENVPAIISPVNKPHYQKWLDFLDSLGYSSYNEILNGCDFGVAQNRERMFCVSLLGNYNYKFPNPMELRKCMEDYFEDLTEEQALQLIVKSEKARDLLVELDEKGELSKL